jgi:nucleotide-binding universal stress UspA family protein
MRVVLALDASQGSQEVLTEFLSRPWPAETAVRVLSVIDLFEFIPRTDDTEEFIRNEDELAEKLVATARERIEKQGIMATSSVLRGYPATEIVDSAGEWAADFVMVGSHGRSGIARMILGSTARTIVRTAPCSVEIVRATGRQPDGKKRIILATDGSDYSYTAARSLASRPWPNGTEVKVLSIMDPDIPAIDPWYSAGQVLERIREDNAKHAEKITAETAEILSGKGLAVSKLVVSGVPKWRIVDEARDWESNLIVVGSHGRRGITRLLLGSVSESVAMHAHCSVEVTRKTRS